MTPVDSYLNHLNEDFDFMQKVFKAKQLQKIVDGIKKNVRGNKVNIKAIKSALKPIPVMTQDKINKFLSKYIPNYSQNYKTSERYFKNKYPSDENMDTLSGVTALVASMDTNTTLQQQLKRSDKLYSSAMGSSGGGGAFVLFVTGLGILMTVFSLDFLQPGTVLLAAILGGLLMLASVMSLLRG